MISHREARPGDRGWLPEPAVTSRCSGDLRRPPSAAPCAQSDKIEGSWSGHDYIICNTYKVLDVGVTSAVQESLDCVKMTGARSEMEDCLAILKRREKMRVMITQHV